MSDHEPEPEECIFSDCHRPASSLSEIGFCELHRLEAQGQTTELLRRDWEWLIGSEIDEQTGMFWGRSDA